jgi:hypothetical protein
LSYYNLHFYLLDLEPFPIHLFNLNERDKID